MKGVKRKVKENVIPYLKDNKEEKKSFISTRPLQGALQEISVEKLVSCQVNANVGSVRKSLFRPLKETKPCRTSNVSARKPQDAESIRVLPSQISDSAMEQTLNAETLATDETLNAEIIYVLPPELIHPVNEETVEFIEKTRIKPRIVKTEIYKPQTQSHFSTAGTSRGTQCSVEYRSVGTDPLLSLGLLDISMFEKDYEGIHFYTGLETYKKSEMVFSTLEDAVPYIKYRHSRVLCVTPKNQFFLTLMKLRRNTPDFELSRFFGVSTGTVSNIFVTWVNFIHQLWSQLDTWPSRELVDFYMPKGFKKHEPTTRALFDATEIPIAKPSNIKDQQCTFSYYKNRNTFKELLATTPGGLISFCSPAYGGSTSDREIFERSKIIDKFDDKDSIMADRGFNVQDLCAPNGVRVNIPHFLKGRSQLPGFTILQDRKLSSKEYT